MRVSYLEKKTKKHYFSEVFAVDTTGSNGMKTGAQWVLLVAVAIAFVSTSAEENGNDEKFSKSSCNFTLSFLKQVVTKYNASNIIFSPASISIVLSVLQQAAKENTLTQLESVLKSSAEESREGFFNFASLKNEKNVILDWGNRIYVRPGLNLQPDFQSTVEKYFDVGIKEHEFGVPTPADSAALINKWVREITHDRIKDLVDPSVMSPDTIMLLINAIFFKGTWLSPFKKGKTAEDKFEVDANNSVQTLFMSQREKFYADKDTSLGAKWVHLFFQNKRFSMVFILPTKKHKLNQLIDKMTADDLHEIFSSRSVSQVKLRIPKFKLTEKVSLVDTLREIGLTDIFGGESDLSGMTAEREHLQVSDVIHQATVEIDEKGSTGSAGTIVLLLRMRTPNLSFVADQPFLFFLIDAENKVPIFAGKVVNPKS